MRPPYDPFDTADYTPSTTPPTPFGTDLVVLANIAALKAIETPNLPFGTVRNVASNVSGEVRQAWEYTEGEAETEYEDDLESGVVIADDYDAETNNNYWRRTL